MKHHYNKEEMIELKRKYDMQVSKEAIEEIKHTIDLDREIEELKAEIKELNDDIIWWTNRFNAVERYNERLNNIINELEKWLKDYIKLFDKPDMLEEQTLEDLKEVLDKLQELKGDSSNE